MGSDERRRLKEAVSEAQRERYATEQHVDRACGGCGSPQTVFLWSCSTCRERQKKQHQRELAEVRRQADFLRSQLRHLNELLDNRDATIAKLRRERAQAAYTSEEERQAARRRTWRESKRRSAERKKAA